MSEDREVMIRHQKSWIQALPKLPESDWCDFRRDFASGMTLKAIGEKYICDPRTVRRCILQNLSSDEIGRQTATRKLDPYLPRIQRMYEEITSESASRQGIVSISQKIHEEIVRMGFPGCERTVRNYLHALEEQTVDQDKEEETLSASS